MAQRWPWFERRWQFDLPAAKFPEILERLRGTAARVEELIADLDPETLQRRSNGGWSILENLGHLGDLEPLWDGRLDDLLEHAEVMREADLTNAATHQADHNASSAADLARRFRSLRQHWVGRLESLPEDLWSAAARHPRLDAPLRTIDLCQFVADHDDCHLAAMRGLARGR